MAIRIRNRVNSKRLVETLINNMDHRNVKALVQVLAPDIDAQLVQRDLEGRTYGIHSPSRLEATIRRSR